MRRLSRCLVVCTFALAIASWSAGSPMAAAPSKSDQLKGAMRKLWEDHITWTRLFIVSSLGDLPDKQATTDRLLQNQTDLGNAIKPYYGDAAGEKLTSLLRDHILIAADSVGAAKAGDTAKLNASKAKWSANADDIAAFLSGANPQNWPAAEMKSMLHDHLQVTTTELEARLHKDWKADVAAYDEVQRQALMMADAFSEGIMKQFPEKMS
jgi:hypothetical protein